MLYLCAKMSFLDGMDGIVKDGKTQETIMKDWNENIAIVIDMILGLEGL